MKLRNINQENRNRTHKQRCQRLEDILKKNWEGEKREKKGRESKKIERKIKRLYFMKGIGSY